MHGRTFNATIPRFVMFFEKASLRLRSDAGVPLDRKRPACATVDPAGDFATLAEAESGAEASVGAAASAVDCGKDGGRAWRECLRCGWVVSAAEPRNVVERWGRGACASAPAASGWSGCGDRNGVVSPFGKRVGGAERRLRLRLEVESLRQPRG